MITDATILATIFDKECEKMEPIVMFADRSILGILRVREKLTKTMASGRTQG